MTRHEAAVDTRIAAAYGAYHAALQKERDALRSARSARQSVQPYGRNHRLGAADLQVDILRAWATDITNVAHLRARTACLTALEVYAAAQVATAAAQAAYRKEDDAYEGWSRFYLVTSSSKGHVHRSLYCSTCYPTTEYAWLPELSGLTEADAVADQGEILCSVCFPTAPVAWTAGISKADAAAKAARDAEKAARDAAKDAKALATPDGSVLRVKDGHGYSERLNTVVAAERWYVAHLSDTQVYGTPALPDESVAAILGALAHKRGTTAEDEHARLAPRAEAKVKRDRREIASYK